MDPKLAAIWRLERARTKDESLRETQVAFEQLRALGLVVEVGAERCRTTGLMQILWDLPERVQNGKRGKARALTSDVPDVGGNDALAGRRSH